MMLSSHTCILKSFLDWERRGDTVKRVNHDVHTALGVTLWELRVRQGTQLGSTALGCNMLIFFSDGSL